MLRQNLYGLILILTCSSSVSNAALRPPSEFPSEAIAFFERELVNVDTAVAKKDRAALWPVLTRLKEFLGSWGYYGYSVEEFQNYEVIRKEYGDCMHAVDNIVALGLDQLNPNLSPENRTSRKGLLALLDSCRKDAEAQAIQQPMPPPSAVAAP